jgi:hypothetical protein
LGHRGLSEILHHVLDEHGALGDIAFCCSESVYPFYMRRREGALPTTTSAPSLLTRVILLESVAIVDDYV